VIVSLVITEGNFHTYKEGAIMDMIAW